MTEEHLKKIQDTLVGHYLNLNNDKIIVTSWKKKSYSVVRKINTWMNGGKNYSKSKNKVKKDYTSHCIHVVIDRIVFRLTNYS